MISYYISTPTTNWFSLKIIFESESPVQIFHGYLSVVENNITGLFEIINSLTDFDNNIIDFLAAHPVPGQNTLIYNPSTNQLHGLHFSSSALLVAINSAVPLEITTSTFFMYSEEDVYQAGIYQHMLQNVASSTVYNTIITTNTIAQITTPIMQQNIQTAVNLWCSDPATATSTYGPISGWNTSAITNMNALFFDQEYFNDDISRWDTSNVTNMESMFKSAYSFNQDLSGWIVGNVTSMGGMFESAMTFNQNISSWNVGSVIDLNFMFLAISVFPCFEYIVE